MPFIGPKNDEFPCDKGGTEHKSPVKKRTFSYLKLRDNKSSIRVYLAWKECPRCGLQIGEAWDEV